MSETKILVVEDDLLALELAEEVLTELGYRTLPAADCAGAVDRMRADRPDAAVLDFDLPDGDALELTARLRDVDAKLPVVVLTAHGTIKLAVEAMRCGVDHFLPKPALPGPLGEALATSLAERRDDRRRRAYDANRERHAPDPFRGDSKAVRELEKRARKVAASEAPVLLQGETGSGKGLLARWLHDHGPRVEEPFVQLNCAALKPELLESELFGHEEGSFTGAVAAKPGLLEVADHGTLFLDEIGDMDLAIQAKLLKVLEEKTFRRVGAVREQRVDVRLLAATSQKVERLMKAQLFRRDLYFRVSTLRLEVPPLRRRWEDIHVLAHYFLDQLGHAQGRSGLGLSPEAVEKLVGYRWPGNIRELRNVLERAVMLADGDVLKAGDLQFDTGLFGDGADSLAFSLEDVERRHIARVLEDEGGAVGPAAERLGIPLSSLYKKIKKYGLNRG